MSSSRDAVSAVLQLYFDGLYHSDVERLGRALHSRAIYATVTEGPLTYYTMDQYLPIVAARPSPADRGEIRRDAIESIEFAGTAHAFARVRCAIGHKHFTDLLTLVMDEGRWQILSKVFHFELEDGPRSKCPT